MSRGPLAQLRRIAELRGLLLPPLIDAASELQNAERQLKVGAHTYTNTARVVTYAGEPARDVTVGAYCSIAAEVVFLTGGNHRLDWVSTYPLRARLGLDSGEERDDVEAGSRGPITVGNDVWIGRGAVILSGVTIGDGAVVGTQAVVAKDVAPYAIVVGNPAREVRKRFTDDEIVSLLRIRWWDWSEVEIARAIDVLNGGSIDDLVAYDRGRGS
jgi:acetyltransferase-like isoleucine patch superfamily enzyme